MRLGPPCVQVIRLAVFARDRLTQIAVRVSQGGSTVPEFMDVHEGMDGITPEQLAEAHQADLDIQDEEGVNFKHAWADPKTRNAFCFSDAPNPPSLMRIHTHP